jgi:hypothetical protein
MPGLKPRAEFSCPFRAKKKAHRVPKIPYLRAIPTCHLSPFSPWRFAAWREILLQRVVSPIPVNPQSPNQARALSQVICGQMVAAYQIQHSQWLGHLVHI